MCNDKKNNNRSISSNNNEKRSINESCTSTKPATRPRPKPPGGSLKKDK